MLNLGSKLWTNKKICALEAVLHLMSVRPKLSHDSGKYILDKKEYWINLTIFVYDALQFS